MGSTDKASHKIEDLKGRVKQVAGRATGDRDLEVDGKRDQVKAAVKDVGEKIKDVGEKAKRLVES
jgi:uncharacterized protein YjbJ (UPF0337 family)